LKSHQVEGKLLVFCSHDWERAGRVNDDEAVLDLEIQLLRGEKKGAIRNFFRTNIERKKSLKRRWVV